MTPEIASKDVERLLITGKPYAQNVGRAVDFMKEAADHAFIYWKPETGTYAINVEPEFQKEAFIALHKAGIGALTDLDKNANEETGWICVHHPRTYSAFRNLNKYASWTDSAGKLALTGALLTGLGVGGYKFLMPSEGYSRSWKGRLENAKDAAIPASILGLIPGLMTGVSIAMKANDIPWYKAFTTKFDELPGISKNYNAQKIQEDLEYKHNNPGQEAKSEDKTVKAGSLDYIMGPLDLSKTDVVKVDAFNRLTWDATKDGTLDHRNAMLTSGVLNATKERTGSGLVSPFNIAGTLVNAGIGYVTAGVIGKTLGAMGMMSNSGQQKLREMGAWGGLLQGVGNCIR